MKLNWKVRLKNKLFWVTIVPLVLVLTHKVLAIFGIDFDYEGISAQIVEIIEYLFLILGVLGVVVDPTTKGIEDSDLAMTYECPKE